MTHWQEMAEQAALETPEGVASISAMPCFWVEETEICARWRSLRPGTRYFNCILIGTFCYIYIYDKLRAEFILFYILKCKIIFNEINIKHQFVNAPVCRDF